MKKDFKSSGSNRVIFGIELSQGKNRKIGKKKHKKYGKSVFADKEKKKWNRKIEDVSEGQIFWVKNKYLNIPDKKTIHHPVVISYKRGMIVIHKGSSNRIGYCKEISGYVKPNGTEKIYRSYFQIPPVTYLLSKRLEEHMGKLKNADFKELRDKLCEYLKRNPSRKNSEIIDLIEGKKK